MIDAPEDAPRKVLVTVPDGMGGTRHEWRDAPPVKVKDKKERRAPDPIHANPEAAAQQLKQLIERKENLIEERRGINDDIRDLDSEVKSLGYNVKAYNAIISLRQLDPTKRAESEALIETYKTCLGLE